jgi:hypothetical protein
MERVQTYFAELSAAIGAGWNRFWFTPSRATTLAVIRILAGLLALYAVATYYQDLDRWFSPKGMLPQSMIEQLYRPEGLWLGQRSMFDLLPPSMLWPAYWASLGVIALFTLGVGGRITAVLATIATLSFFSRAPLVTGEFEFILAFLLVYLCLGRASDELSVPAFLRRNSANPAPSIQHPASAATTISLRLTQIHLAIVHLMMGWAQLAAPEGAWWSGEGVWLAAMRPGMSLVDVSLLTDHPRIVATWSHLVTLYLLAFPALVWGRLTRPLILALGVFVWTTFALASGWLMFCLAMLTALVAFCHREATPTR